MNSLKDFNRLVSYANNLLCGNLQFIIIDGIITHCKSNAVNYLCAVSLQTDNSFINTFSNHIYLFVFYMLPFFLYISHNNILLVIISYTILLLSMKYTL